MDRHPIKNLTGGTGKSPKDTFHEISKWEA
jgi:hypothetical protein